MPTTLWQHLLKHPSAQLTLACTTLASLTSGTIYSFPLFGPRLGERLKYSTSEVNILISVWDYAGSLTAPVVGELVGRWAARWCLLLAALGLFISYAGLSSAFVQGSGGLLLISAYFFLLGLSNSTVYAVCTVVTARRFPTRFRGTTLGLVISALGLSAFVISLIDRSWYASSVGTPDTAGLLWFLALATGLVNFLVAFFIPPSSSTSSTSYVPVATTRDTSPNNIKMMNLAGTTTTTIEEEEEAITLGEEAVRSKFWKDPLFYGIGLVIFLAAGSGRMYISNLGSVCEAQKLFDWSHLHPTTKVSEHEIQLVRDNHVTLFSVMSFSGRLSLGGLSDRTLFRSGGGGGRWPWVGVAVGLMMIGQFIAGLVDNNTILSICTIIIGFGYGGVYSLTPTIVSELWGERNLGFHWYSSSPHF